MPDGLPLFKPPYSRITAIDMHRGEHRWMVPAGAGERIRKLPALQGLDLPPLGGDSTFSGPLLTKTLLIYALTTGGTAAARGSSATTRRPGRNSARPTCPARRSARR